MPVKSVLSKLIPTFYFSSAYKAELCTCSRGYHLLTYSRWSTNVNSDVDWRESAGNYM